MASFISTFFGENGIFNDFHSSEHKVDDIDYFFAPMDKSCNLLSIDIIFLCIPKKKLIVLNKFFLSLMFR